MRMIGVARSPAYSPGVHADNDRLILEATADGLRRRGWHVQLIAEAEVDRLVHDVDAIFSMAQGAPAIASLSALAGRGMTVVNHPAAVARCCRAALHDWLAGDPLLPSSLLVDTADAPAYPQIATGRRIWLKRSGPHAMTAGDVVAVEDEPSYRAALEDMRSRGIARAIVQSDVTGPTVKFYGVIGTGFFRAYREDGEELVDSVLAKLRRGAEALMTRIGLDVFGGDCILAGDGMRIIDVNDWPSFARCRDAAAEAIAGLIDRRGIDHGTRLGALRRA